MADSRPSGGGVFAALALFLLLGAPLSYFAWGGLSHLLAGQWNPGEFAIGAAALVAFVGLAAILYRWIARQPTN